MISNHSPWIQQLKRTRPVVPLDKDTDTEVCIVGGGIAGAVTAFFVLRATDTTVLLLEADKIAHGATGHNAGQIASYFERPLFELVEEFGLDLAIDGQRSVESGWALLDEIVGEAGLQTPLHRFIGHAGLSSLAQVLSHLKNNRYRVEGGLPAETIFIAEEWEARKDIPEIYRDLYTTVAHTKILTLLETNNPGYIASLSYQKGCMNSALFTEELVGYLINTYKNRFSFYEGSPVKTVRLKERGGTLEVLTHTVRAQKIVLCTNGFENFSISNEAGEEIDTSFHHSIAGRIGYMSGYVEKNNDPPTAISYFLKTYERMSDPTGENYFYLTRRPHEHENNDSYSLVCTGGPEKVLPNGAGYSREHACSEYMSALIDDFLRHNYNKHPGKETEYAFCWHGLMGYTPNGIRRVGPEPKNPALLYNLGCNGVGILPSIFAGKRISEFLQGRELPVSIFDPHDQMS
ncbi:MAG: Gamma-glutamylputrescine oxidoreductase [Syntrophomonadaceae bacterium]|nr:Gamma-glutamylputrescine oxidoreductase [Bacillota bacterium]